MPTGLSYSHQGLRAMAAAKLRPQAASFLAPVSRRAAIRATVVGVLTLMLWALLITLLLPPATASLSSLLNGRVDHQTLLIALASIAFGVFGLALAYVTSRSYQEPLQRIFTLKTCWRWHLLLIGVVVNLSVMLTGDLVLRLTRGDPSGTELSESSAVALAVLLLVMPFQVAGEETVFRSWIPRQLASLAGWRGSHLVIACTLSSVAFAATHRPASQLVWLELFLSAMLASLLVLWLGGLEAAIGFHLGNNAAYYLSNSMPIDKAVGAGDVVASLVLMLLSTASAVGILRLAKVRQHS